MEERERRKFTAERSVQSNKNKKALPLTPAYLKLAMTSCLIVGVAITLAVLVDLMPLTSFEFSSTDDPRVKSGHNGHMEKITLSQHSLLKHQYTLDFSLLMKEREEAMKRFTFPYNLEGVDKRDHLSLEEFTAIYDGKWPVIITDVVPTWPAFNWTQEYFLSHYGNEKVAMKAVHNSVFESLSLPLRLYLRHLEESSESTWTYLTDELFLTQRPELRNQIWESAYTKDNYFALFPKELQPWDCMLLWGTAHSRSTLHIDPYNWTGTNAVIAGRKLWKLIPPGQDGYLSIDDVKKCGFPMDCLKYNSPLDAYDPSTLKKIRQNVHMLEVEQQPGEMLFIPTGWFHQAYNPVPTLAVSGQLMNANNYLVVLEEMIKGGSISRKALPRQTDHMSPAALVSHLASTIAPHIVSHGAQVTADALKQMESGIDRKQP